MTAPWTKQAPSTSRSHPRHQLAKLLSTLDAVPHGCPGCILTAPTPAEQEELHKEPRKEVAGPFGQGCSHSPSAPKQDMEHSPKEYCHAPKRRASTPQDSPQPHRRTPC